ncbi:MAG TPA: hypothetical protein EYP67_00365 [Methanosarcinales archaeon]|nr:hypothetical protein [Methanosarcinales archaeon]
MKSKTIGIVSLLCCALILTSCAYGMGVGASPAKMEVEIGNSEDVQKNITVSNPEDVEMGFQVYTENESIDWIQISDPTFSLESHQKKEVTIRFAPDADEVGEFDTKICVVALNSEGGFNIGSGVKIPTHITIKKAAVPFYTNRVIIILIIIGLFIILIGVGRLRRH